MIQSYEAGNGRPFVGFIFGTPQPWIAAVSSVRHRTRPKLSWRIAWDRTETVISTRYKTTAHRCLCGCGEKVVAPLTPTGWNLTFDGRTASLYPSIGNWNLVCKSHYWIRKNVISVAPPWTTEQIRYGFRHDQQSKEAYYRNDAVPTAAVPGKPVPQASPTDPQAVSWIERVWQRLFGR